MHARVALAAPQRGSSDARHSYRGKARAPHPSPLSEPHATRSTQTHQHHLSTGTNAVAAARPASNSGSGAPSHVAAVWTRPTPDRNEDWVKPSYIPPPQQAPVILPREEPRPLYAPAAPEFRPAETPDKQSEMPEAPKMPGEG